MNVQYNQGPPTFFDQNMSGNIRLESQFTRVQDKVNMSAITSTISDLSPKPTPEAFGSQERINESEISRIVGASSSVAAATENKSAIGKLDDLIQDFSKPVTSENL